MPIARLLNHEGKLDPESVLRLVAVMAEPNDTTLQSQFLARVTEQTLATAEAMAREEHAEEIERFPGVFERVFVPLISRRYAAALQQIGGFAALRDAPGIAEVRERMLAAFWPGSIVGDMLINVLQTEASGLGGSVRKAVFIAKDYLAHATTGDGRSLGATERFIQDSWSKYKAVAHFWAAYRLWFFEGSEVETRNPNPDSALSPYHMETLPAFLSLAMAALHAGANHTPHGRSEPTLILSEAWVPPEELPLPEVTIELHPLEPQKIELLKSYKPRA